MKKNKLKVIIISGPTASGKTKLSLEIAQKFNSKIINFDSLLFYHELNIGTAKPDQSELNLANHYLINICSVKNPLNAADYIKLAHKQISEFQKESEKLIILVGGSGFYLQALINGMFKSISTPGHILNKSEEIYKKQGIAPFIEILKVHDNDSFKRYHENDHYRIRRAVEHFWTNGTAFSKSRESMPEKTPYYKEQNWELIHYYLNIPKEEHLKIINKRTESMLKLGLINEVKDLIKSKDYTGEEKPMQSIGYKEVLAYLRGEITSKEELIELINIHTRQLAKSQRTWFNKVKDKIEINPLNNYDFIFNQINEFINS